METEPKPTFQSRISQELKKVSISEKSKLFFITSLNDYIWVTNRPNVEGNRYCSLTISGSRA